MVDSKSNPLVTIYIPSKDYGRFLAQSVESVRNQLYMNWEVLIFDEGSTDETGEIGAAYAVKFPEKIRYIRHPTALGLQRCANEALQLANGKYLMRLDADDWLDESALLILVSRAEKSDAPGIVFGSYYYANETGDVIGIEHQLNLWDEDRSGLNPPHGACTLIRTRSLKAAGGYSIDINAQDGWELWFKLQGRTSAASVSTPVFYYRQHGSSLSRDVERLFAARVKIFSTIRQRLAGGYSPNVLAVIPVRESYPHLPNVPYIQLAGKSVLERAIGEAQAATAVTDVMVSADQSSVLDYCEQLEQQGLVKPHLRVCRPEILNGENIHLLRILQHASNQYSEITGHTPDIVLFLNMHAVLRTRDAISKAVDAMLVTEVDTVVSVVEERNPVFVHSNQGLELIGNGRFDNLFHRKEQVFRYNGGIIGAWWEVLNQGTLWGERIGYVEMTPKSSFTLTKPSDLAYLEEMLQQSAETLVH